MLLYTATVFRYSPRAPYGIITERQHTFPSRHVSPSFFSVSHVQFRYPRSAVTWFPVLPVFELRLLRRLERSHTNTDRTTKLSRTSAPGTRNKKRNRTSRNSKLEQIPTFETRRSQSDKPETQNNTDTKTHTGPDCSALVTLCYSSAPIYTVARSVLA